MSRFNCLLCAVVLISTGVFTASAQPRPRGRLAPQRVEVDEKGVQFKLPRDWPDDLPLPTQVQNCVRCHVDKGGALSAAVLHYSLSTHDREEMSCVTCHGGNVDDDEKAHEGDFISGKLSALMERCGDCHQRETRFIRQSAHFSPTIKFDYPICSTCHDNHSTGLGGVRLANACGSCHGAVAKASTGSGESAILWSARREGQEGNKISITLLAGEKNQSLAVGHVRNGDAVEVTVKLATDAEGRSISTAEQVLDALWADQEIYPIIKTEVGDNSLGEGIVQPAERFTLTGGLGFEDKYPLYGELVAANDRLWEALGAIRRARQQPPEALNEEIAKVRNLAMRLLHAVPARPDPEEARAMVERSAALEKALAAHAGP